MSRADELVNTLERAGLLKTPESARARREARMKALQEREERVLAGLAAAKARRALEVRVEV